jgi:hypothetical protein
MRSFSLASLFIVLTWSALAVTSADAGQLWAPPIYLPSGSVYVDASHRIAKVPYWVPGSNQWAYQYYEIVNFNTVPLYSYLPGPSASPMLFPAPRSTTRTITTLRYPSNTVIIQGTQRRLYGR